MNRFHSARSGAWKLYKGSRKRLQRITVVEHSPVRFWIYAILVLTALAILFGLLTTSPPAI
jgi:hypothetical protein